MPRNGQEFLPSHHRHPPSTPMQGSCWPRSAHSEGKAIRSILTVMASAVALCGCAAQPMYWAKPDTSQVTFKQRWESSSQATFKQRWPKISGETPHPRRGKKDREAARLAQGLNGLDW